MPSPNQLLCPRCQHPLDRVRVGISQCPHCAAWIRLPKWPFALVLLVSFVASLLIAQVVRLKAYAAILWIPIFLVCLRFLPSMIPMPLPALVISKEPSAKLRWRRNLDLFFALWAAWILMALANCSIEGGTAFMVGASSRDLREIADTWSLPLGWVNSAFILRPNTSFLALFGIVSANSYFYALATAIVLRTVQRILRRGRVQELGLSHHTLDDDDLP
jgi:hypothetical protein